MQYLELGPCPYDEKPLQVGLATLEEMKAETKVFILQLRRSFPKAADLLRIKTFPHNFGSYCEAVCDIDDSGIAFDVDQECPANWDAESLDLLAKTKKNHESSIRVPKLTIPAP